MFADDLTMLSRMKSGLDRMLECSWEYSIKWRFKFNSSKSIILTLGENNWERGVNQNTIKKVETWVTKYRRKRKLV